MVVDPAIEVTTAQLGPVVDHQHVRIASFPGHVVQHRDHTLAGQREVDCDRRALARAVVLQVGCAELAAVGQAVLGEVQRPALVSSDRAPASDAVATEAALLPAAPADRQLLLTVQPLDAFVVHAPALSTQQLVQPAVAEPSTLAGENPEPFTQPLLVAGPPRFPRQPPSARSRSACRHDAATAHARSAPWPPPPAVPQASPVFCQQPSERLVVEHQVVPASNCFKRRFSSAKSLSRLASDTVMPPNFARHL